MVTTDHLRDALADRSVESALVLVVDSRPTVRQALLVTLDLLGFDVVVVDSEVEGLVSIDELQPGALIVEDSLWSGMHPFLIDRAHLRSDLRRMPVIVLGERARWSMGETGPRSLAVHHIPRTGDLNELIRLLDSARELAR